MRWDRDFKLIVPRRELQGAERQEARKGLAGLCLGPTIRSSMDPKIAEVCRVGVFGGSPGRRTLRPGHTPLASEEGIIRGCIGNFTHLQKTWDHDDSRDRSRGKGRGPLRPPASSNDTETRLQKSKSESCDEVKGVEELIKVHVRPFLVFPLIIVRAVR
jgi:hypothetical protein